MTDALKAIQDSVDYRKRNRGTTYIVHASQLVPFTTMNEDNDDDDDDGNKVTLNTQTPMDVDTVPLNDSTTLEETSRAPKRAKGRQGYTVKSQKK